MLSQRKQKEIQILVSAPDVAIDHLFPPYTVEKVRELKQ